MNIDDCIKEFVKYAKQYDLTVPEIMGKFHHTFRVVEYAKDIARSEKLSESDINLAMVCALLHDISRFKEWTMYHTFIDAKAFDHGDEAYNILASKNFISRFAKNRDEERIILKAVKNHNKYKIEDGLDYKELLMAKIVRDADKLDIMKEQGTTINGSFVLNALYIRPFQEKRLFTNEKVTGEYEITLRILAFIYDYNFKYCYELIKKEDIIKNRIDLLESHTNNVELLEYVKSITTKYVDEKLQTL